MYYATEVLRTVKPYNYQKVRRPNRIPLCRPHVRHAQCRPINSKCRGI